MQASDLKKKSVDELNEELVALRREQFNLRMQPQRYRACKDCTERAFALGR
jgi:large subunit ribosomal protein L29